MHIAHILRKYVPAEWGGTETALHRLAGGLARHSVKSTVFCPAVPQKTRDGGPQTRRPASPDPLVEAGCEIKRFHACVPVWGLSVEQKRRILSVGGNLLSFDLPRMLAREPGIAVVHTHTLGRLGGIALTAARKRRLPFVVTIHGGVLDLPDHMKAAFQSQGRAGVEWGRVFGWWWRARAVLTDADAILTCNPREAALLQERYPGKRIVSHPHGVDTASFETDHRPAARAAYPAIAGRQVLLCVGRIDPPKNQSWMVQRMPEVLKHHPEAILVLAGASTNQEYHAAVLRDVKTLGLEDRVLFTGGLPPGDPRLIGLLQEASALVLPSHSETFGIVLLEAWAARTPVLASPTSGAKALIRHGENGWLFDLDSPRSFLSALGRTLADPSLAAGQAASGRRLVETEYTTVTIARRMRDLYAELISEHDPVRHPA